MTLAKTRLSRSLLLAAIACLLVLPTARASISGVHSGPALYINTTEDMELLAGQCLPGNICTLRAAIELAQSVRAAVRVCFEDNCPLGALPMTLEDPNYDPVTERWIVRFDPTYQALIVTEAGVDMDLTEFVDGWDGPEDNKIVVDAGTQVLNHLMTVEGSRNKFAGFEIRGSFADAAILVRNGATANQFGPGLAFAGFPQGVGMRIIDAGTVGNKIVGSWCGLTLGADKEVIVDGLQEDCVHIANGASDNIIGGPAPQDRNVLSGSVLGFGVALHDDATRNNVVQGNYIGTDPTGTTAAGNGSGIMIADQASGTKVVANVISGNRNAGILASGCSTEFGRTTTLIEGNIVGADASGSLPVPNGVYGVEIRGEVRASPAKDVKVLDNEIKFNGVGGVFICGPETRNNTVSENEITANSGIAIKVCEGANDGVEPAELTLVSMNTVEGTACPGCRIEIFSDPASEAAVYEGWTEAEPDGIFWLDKPSGFAYRNVTTTVTDGKSTSGLSKVVVIGKPTLTPTLRPGEKPRPTSTPRPTRVTWRRVYTPWLARDSGF